MITAKEAKELVRLYPEKNAVQCLSDILYDVKYAAEHGKTAVVYTYFVPDRAKEKLVELGYKVEVWFYEKAFRISWDE